MIAPCEVLDAGVRARVVAADVAVVLPADGVGRRSSLAQHLEDLGVALWLALVVGTDDESVPRLCAQYWWALCHTRRFPARPSARIGRRHGFVVRTTT